MTEFLPENAGQPSDNVPQEAPKKRRAPSRAKPKQQEMAIETQPQPSVPAEASESSGEASSKPKPRRRAPKKKEEGVTAVEPRASVADESSPKMARFEYAPAPMTGEEWNPGMVKSIPTQALYTGLPDPKTHTEPEPIASFYTPPVKEENQEKQPRREFQRHREGQRPQREGYQNPQQRNHPQQQRQQQQNRPAAQQSQNQAQPQQQNPQRGPSQPRAQHQNQRVQPQQRMQPQNQKRQDVQRHKKPAQKTYWSADPRETASTTPVLEGLIQWNELNDPAFLQTTLEGLKINEILNWNHFYQLPLQDLYAELQAMSIAVQKHDTRVQMLKKLQAYASAAQIPFRIHGLIEVMEEGYGLILYSEDSYALKLFNAFISKSLIDENHLGTGHMVTCIAHAPREQESSPVVLQLETVMGDKAENVATLTPFHELTPYYPLQRILLECPHATWDNLSMRIIDLLCPVGLGQRGLIVAPPRVGKTVLLQCIAHAIAENSPEAHLMVLLIDERPEEVTDFRRHVKGEVVSSTFDQSPESHVHAAEMVIAKARRMVESGKHVVILLDSITRLARAYNALMPSSGKILSGGVEANALERPKRFFGSARNIEGGGSLTILGTALIDTGSKMDEVIFEEFKGTGNMELHLDRGLADKRIFPALNIEKSGTRKEELLYHTEELVKIYALRRTMKGLPVPDAMEMVIQRVKKSKTNAEFLLSLAR